MTFSVLSGCLKKAAALLSRYGIPDDLFSRFFSAYFIVSVYQLISARLQKIDPITEWKDFVAAFPLAVKLLWVIIVFWLLSVLRRHISEKHRAVDQIVLLGSSVLFSLCLVWGSGNFYLGVASAAVTIVLSVYAVGRLDRHAFERLSNISAGVITFTAAGAMALFIAVTTICIHLNFGTSCFDMGIFVQTFNSLKEHFNAVITCERDRMMSHFNVHSSYIFYLFLPVYMLFPTGGTLLAAQAIFVTAGVVPLFLLAKKHGFKGFALVSVCFAYVFYDGLVMPCYFQFHENAFLPTILMWLLYAIDQRKIPLFYIMSALTCIVKEDAPLYVLCIALFFAAEEKGEKRKHGIIGALLSVCYFSFVVGWLTSYGDGGFMTATRLGNLMIDSGDGILSVIRNVLADPGYFISLFVQEGTLLFFIQTMLPLLFLPFLTKKLHRFLLMIPYVIMNLVIGAGYGYASNIGFQYIFGPACLLIYMTLRNVEEIPEERRNMLIMSAAIAAMVTTVSMVSVKQSAVERHYELQEYYQSAGECIRSVPKDASVLANTFLLPHIADRDRVYELDSGCFAEDEDGNIVGIVGLENYDFCVFKKNDDMTVQARPFLDEAGWTVYAESEGDFVIILVSPVYSIRSEIP